MLLQFLLLLFTALTSSAPPRVLPPPADSLNRIPILEQNLTEISTDFKSAFVNSVRDTKKDLTDVDIINEQGPNQLEKPAHNGVPDKKPVKRPELVKPPDHLKVVPLEKDGDLNDKFLQEIMQPDETDEKVVVDDAAKEEDKVVEKIFKKIDVNGDAKISKDELKNYISDNIIRHLDEGINENKRVFDIVDANKDGYATWEEYHYHFLIDNKLMDPESAKNHNENEHKNVDVADQERMEIELQQWHEADNDPKDGRLSPDEFLAFRHPEHGKSALDNMVREIFQQLDIAEGDGKLSEAEFVSLVPNAEKPNGAISLDKERENRRKEFHEIDTDKNGFLDFKEMLVYVNPRNPRHAIRETEELFAFADADKDNLVSEEEFRTRKDLFLGSSVVDPGSLMHDEF